MTKASVSERIRGRRAVALRTARLTAEPLCRHCRAEGRITAATVPDHIIPLTLGGVEDGLVVSPNIQCLCEDCHRRKTDTDGSAIAGPVQYHPEWLKPSAIPLTIVCGPPCSGKTTYVEQHRQPGDTVICVDEIRARIRPGYVHWSMPQDRDLLRMALRQRNAELGALSRASTGSAWLIIGAPTVDERTWWQAQLGGSVVLLDPGAAECCRRADARGTPAAKAGIAQWHAAAGQPWIRAVERQRTKFTTDGRPVW